MKATPWLSGFSVLLGLAVIASILLPLFIENSQSVSFINKIVDQILLVLFGSYFYLRLFLATNKFGFLKKRWPEGIAASIALIFGFQLILSDFDTTTGMFQILGFGILEQTLLALIQIYLVFLVILKIVQSIPKVLASNKNPARLVLGSFILVTLVGMFLLMLPASTVDSKGLPLIDALFMATSAICVTGLIVVDTATYLTTFGQGVILLLIQLGGIGVVTFATFLSMYLSGGIGLIEKNVLKETISGEEVFTISRTLKRIVLLTFAIEFIGMILYYISWQNAIPDSGERFWFALFHSISAFCNAGFSIFTNSLADTINVTSIPINLTTMVLIILGGLGFTTLWESIERMKKRNSQRQWTVHSYIVLRMTLFLIIIGTCLVLILEWNGVLAGYSFGDKLLIATFQSVTSRTAGFNTIDTGALTAGTTMIVVLLMLIGGSPSSTAGGLKTTTIYILYKAMMANISGSNKVEVYHRTIPTAVILRAVTAAFLSVLFLMTGLILLTIFEDFDFIDILFEQVSAFMTVGLSRGITGALSDPGKWVIIVTMFAGRVGMLTIAVALVKKIKASNYQYPQESVMVA